MARKNTVKLLLINSSDNESERLVSLFRRAGKVARAKRVATPAELTSALTQAWDLLIADDRVSALPPPDALALLRDSDAVIPALLVLACDDPQSLFAAGARDVVAPGDDQRLICAALRELDYRAMCQRLDQLQQQLTDAERRNALLLGESARAVAYVTDGMITGASPLFAQRFGYVDGDDIDCAPIIDLVEPASHEQVKAALKSQDGSAVPFEGLTTGRERFAAMMQLTASTYDGEPCIQITVSERGASAGQSGVGSDHDDSGLFSRGWFCNYLNSAGGTLLIASIDNFLALRRQLGYSASQQLATDIGRFIAGLAMISPAPVARIADDCFALTVSQDTTAALDLAQQLCDAVSDHIADADGQTLQCTVSVGAVAVAGAAPHELLDRGVAACEQLREKDLQGQGNGAQLYQPKAGEQPRHSAASPQAALQDALDEGRFQLLFQPIISLRGGRGDHYEALLRITGETDLELPDNLIGQLGIDADNARLDRWVLLETTKRLAENRAHGNDTRLVINLYASALLDETLVAWLGVALRAAGLPPDALVLQLREADVITYLKPARQFVDAVHQLGCQVAIAGFGRTLDPLKTLKTVPVELVQLDGAFTRDLQNSGDATPLKELISTISTQEVNVIIPFVENASVLATLWQVGADFIQGHYLQPPSSDMNYEFADIA